MGGVRCIAVFGASGMTGQAVVAAALRRGLRVRGLYRPGSEPAQVPDGLEVVTGQLSSAEDVRRALTGAEAATCVYGPRIVPRNQRSRSSGSFRREPFCEAATQNVIAGMKELGITRLVCQTGAMAGADASNLGWFYRWLRRRYRRRYAAIAGDREAQEERVRASGLDWVLVRPPYIATKPAKGVVRAATAMRIGFLSRAFVGDLASFHCDELANGRFHRQAVYVMT